MKAREELDEITPYIPSKRRDSTIRLDLNENSRGCSPKVMETLYALNPSDISTYPDCSQLVEEISTYLAVPPDTVLPTNGANEAIQAVMNAYIEKRDRIILPSPTFSMYEILARVRGARLVRVLYNEDFSFPTDRLLSRSGKLIPIVNPGNPTGTCIDKEEFTAIMEEMNDALVVLDETYYHFAGESYGDLVEKFENLVVIHSFSKIHGLAGLRLGVALASEEIIDELRKVIPPFSVNTAAVTAGRAALADTTYLDRMIDDVKKEKELLSSALNELGLETRATATNFILVDVGQDAEYIKNALEKKGILVKDLSSLPLMEGYLRVTIGTRNENTAFLNALRDILHSRKKGEIRSKKEIKRV